MDNIEQYIDAQLIILIPMLWGIGMAIKKSDIENRYIPVLLLLCSVLTAGLKILGDNSGNGDIFTILFARLTQGSVVWLCAWLGYEKYLKGDEGK